MVSFRAERWCGRRVVACRDQVVGGCHKLCDVIFKLARPSGAGSAKSVVFVMAC